jgi:hypothetical protein
MEFLERSLMSAYSADLLRPLVPRIAAIHASRVAGEGHPAGNLARVLVKADCDEGDRAVVVWLEEANAKRIDLGTPLRDVLEALLERSTPLRGEAGRSLLFSLLRRSPAASSDYDGDVEIQLAAFVLAREGSLEALQWLLMHIPGPDDPLADRFLSVQASWQGIRDEFATCTEIARDYFPEDAPFRLRAE